jgi:UTP--glucose-1-phosphate uridylyltransferase
MFTPEEEARLDRALLNSHHFEALTFFEARAALRLGQADPRARGPLKPVDDQALVRGSAAERGVATRRGEAAISAGEVGLLVLAGGAATRFGGGAKAVVEAVGGRSFLQLKLEEAHALGPKIALAAMTSFTTDAQVRAHLRERGLEADVFTQGISVRLNPDGSLFADARGHPSYHPTGHGDVPRFLRLSGTLQRWRARGVRTLFVCNLDNLGARLDATLLGRHLESGSPFSAEVVRRDRSLLDQARNAAVAAELDGQLQLVEGLRLPADFDPAPFPWVSINNLWLQLEALEQDLPMPRYWVPKTVVGRPALQLESILCDLGQHLALQLLEVPGEGEHNRFLPVKTPDDLVRARQLWRDDAFP